MCGDSENKRWSGTFVVIVCFLVVAGLARADWAEQDKMTASDGAAFDGFGISVSISSGGVAIVGANGDDDNGDLSGSAYIFDGTVCLTADLKVNCYVDFFDYAIFADQWLQCGN